MTTPHIDWDKQRPEVGDHDPKDLVALSEYGWHLDIHDDLVLCPSQDAALRVQSWWDRANAAEAERDRLAARVAELEAATVPIDHTGLRERLAALSHRQWVRCARHMLTLLGYLNEAGGVTPAGERRVAAHLVPVLHKWSSLVCSDYRTLSESSRVEPRDWAALVLAEIAAPDVDTGPGPFEPITDTRPLPAPQIGPPDARPIVDDLGAVAAVVRGAAAVLETAGSTDTFADHGTPDTPDTETP